MNNNYLVIDNPLVNNKLCLIFFSSNSVRANTLSQEEDHNYEFYNISRAKRIRKLVKRIIFLRDASNNFYINGINKDINNIKKIIGLLRTLTNGFDCYCCGYSAGGYMSLICKYYLSNIKRVYNFGGVVNVLDWHGAYSNYNYSDREVVAHASELQKSYFDISSKLKEIMRRGGYTLFMPPMPNVI